MFVEVGCSRAAGVGLRGRGPSTRMTQDLVELNGISGVIVVRQRMGLIVIGLMVLKLDVIGRFDVTERSMRWVYNV